MAISVKYGGPSVFNTLPSIDDAKPKAQIPDVRVIYGAPGLLPKVSADEFENMETKKPPVALIYGGPSLSSDFKN